MAEPNQLLAQHLANGLPNLLAHGKRLLNLRQHYAAALAEHPQLVRHSRIANYRLGCIIIHADNNAVATKLNQLSNTLQQALEQHVPELNKIRIAVQPTKVTKS